MVKDNMAIALSVLGSTGKMGKKILELTESDPQFCVVAGHSRQQPNLQTALSLCDVAIDFSLHHAPREHLHAALAANKPIVIGTTGHSDEEKREIEEAAKHIPILYSANYSFGIALCLDAAARFAKALDDTWKIEVVETHHVHKKDIPSGTAKTFLTAMGKKVAIRSLREGEVIGEHTIIFECPHERIELKHTAHSRDTFAKGALLGAKFLAAHPPGLYSFQDLVDLLP